MGQNIIFPKPRILFLSWLEELTGQVKRLKIIQEGDLRVLYQMRKSLREMAIDKYLKSSYLKNYDKISRMTSGKSAAMKNLREEGNKLLTLLCFREITLNREYEFYRRGSVSYRAAMEKKWLKNIEK